MLESALYIDFADAEGGLAAANRTTRLKVSGGDGMVVSVKMRSAHSRREDGCPASAIFDRRHSLARVLRSRGPCR